MRASNAYSTQKKDKAKKAVYSYSAAATTAAVIPVPVADAIAISGVQITMGMHIVNGIYEKNVGVSFFKTLITSYLASQAGLWIWSSVKAIPVFGTSPGIAGQMIVAGTITASLGYALIELCENNIPLTKKNLKKKAKQYKSQAKAAAEDQTKSKEGSIEYFKDLSFHQDKNIDSKSLTFYFNLEDLSNPKLHAIHVNTQQKEVFHLNIHQTEINLHIENWEVGQYEVTLKADDKPDAILYFTKI